MKLLNRTTLHYLIYSVIVLLIVTPVFYWVINGLFIENVDETLFKQKREIQKRIQRMKSPEDLLAWADLDGDVIIKPANGKVFADSTYYLKLHNRHAHEVEPYRVLSFMVTMAGESYHVTARISMMEREDLIEAIAITQFIALIILLSGLLIINWFVSKRIWKPFYSTLEKLETFEVEKAPQLILGSSSVKEFVDLNNALQRLADHNYKTYLSQKEFTENAAHEMQSPLAVFQSKLELLMQTQNLSEEQANLMVSLMDATSRLTKLNRALLMLSKIDNNQFVETETISIVKLTDKLLEAFGKQAGAKNIRIETSFVEDVIVTFNPTLVDILLSNLISNAVKHSVENGVVTVTLSSREWKISNQGNPLNIAPDKIFDRFQKGDTNQANTGLGLAIVKKICEINRISIQYSYQDGKHIFFLIF